MKPATPAAPAGEAATAESLGWQLRSALPPMRLHWVSLCNTEADVLWLSEGAFGPDEHGLVIEAIQALNADKSLPYYELGAEDGRIAIFLAVRAPQGSLVGVVMILAEIKSVQDGIVERMVTAQVRTILQKMAVLLRGKAPPQSDNAATVAMPAPPPRAAAAPAPSKASAQPAAQAPAPDTAATQPISPKDIEEILTLEMETDVQVETVRVQTLKLPAPPPPPSAAPASAPAPRPPAAQARGGSPQGAAKARSTASAPAPTKPTPQPKPAAAAVKSVPAAPQAKKPAAAPPAASMPELSLVEMGSPQVAPAAPVARALSAPAVANAAPAAEADSDTDPASDLVLHVQELIKLRSSGRTRRYEILARSRREASRNEVPPQFLAESAKGREGAVLDGIVVQRLLTWLGEHGDAIWDTEPASFSVNLSIGALEDEHFAQRVASCLSVTNVPAEHIGFEITEFACVQCKPQVQRFVEVCEQLGCFLVVDNFTFDSGALYMLGSSALRAVKLDAKLTNSAMKDKLPQAIVVAIAQACKVMGVHCTAKRIENQAALQWLTAVGCDFAQGFALEKPLPLESLLAPPTKKR